MFYVLNEFQTLLIFVNTVTFLDILNVIHFNKKFKNFLNVLFISEQF